MLFYINQFYINDIYNNIIDVVTSVFFLALFGIATSLSLKYYKPAGSGWGYLFIWIVVLTLIWQFVSVSIIKYINQGEAFLNFVDQSNYIRFIFGFLMFSCLVLVNLIWNHLNDKQEEQERKSKIDQIARDAELNNLRQQLQPHFLFNSLNSINALTISNPEQAREMISKLSEFLRGTLKKDQSKTISLEDELMHLSLYLEIEKVRFGYRLNTNINCAKEIINYKLPPLILQPAIENAIKFGLYDTVEPVTIIVNCMAVENFLKIEIINPFDSLTSNKIHGTGFGLKSINRRLGLLYNRFDLLKTYKSKNIFTTQIIIPQTND